MLGKRGKSLSIRYDGIMVFYYAVVNGVIAVWTLVQQSLDVSMFYFAYLLGDLHSQICVVVASVKIVHRYLKSLAYLAKSVLFALGHKMSVQYLRIVCVESKIRLLIPHAFREQEVDVIVDGVTECDCVRVFQQLLKTRV